LQQDSQIYAPILEHQFDAQALRNDIVVQHPHVAFTLYDEAVLFCAASMGRVSKACLRSSRLRRARCMWGLYLMAAALGLSTGTALTVAGICSLGAAIAGPSVLTFEYEPTPRAFAGKISPSSGGSAGSRTHPQFP
jgi:hypothetical protein